MRIHIDHTFFAHRLRCLMLLGLCVSGGCHTAKKAMRESPKTPMAVEPSPKAVPPGPASAPDAKDLLEKLRTNTLHYQTFSARAKVDITSAGGSQNGISTFIRMKKDSAIWISIRPVLGIELVRVLITPDSVKMINFFKKTVTLRSADSMQQLLDIPYDFQALQNLLIGNPVLLTDSLQDISLDTTASRISFSCSSGKLMSTYSLFPFFPVTS